MDTNIYFSVVKDVILPLIGCVIASFALYVSYRADKRSLQLQHESDRRSNQLILNNAKSAISLFELIAYSKKGGLDTTPHIVELKSLANRLFDSILSSSEIPKDLSNIGTASDNENKGFLMLSNCRVKINNLSGNDNLDPFIYFTLLTLAYVYEVDPGQERSLYEAIELLHQSKPDFYDLFMIKAKERK